MARLFKRLSKGGGAVPPAAPPGMTPGARTMVAVLGMWLGSLTLATSFIAGGGQGMSRSEVAEVLKALAQLVDLEQEDLRRAPEYPAGPVDPVPHPPAR